MNNASHNAAETNDINNLQAEMDRAIEAAANAGLSIGAFKQSAWYRDRKQQLVAMIERH